MRAGLFVSGLGFEWNVWYVYDEMHRMQKTKKKMKSTMNKMDVR